MQFMPQEEISETYQNEAGKNVIDDTTDNIEYMQERRWR